MINVLGFSFLEVDNFSPCISSGLPHGNISLAFSKIYRFSFFIVLLVWAQNIKGGISIKI